MFNKFLLARRTFLTVTMLVITASLISQLPWTANGAAGQGAPGGLMRLHVVANSDSEEDQQLKLAVRNAVVRAIWPQLAEVTSYEEAEQRAAELLPLMAQVARDELRRLGSQQSVRVEKGVYWFPEKQTGDRIVAAGRYHAVRIVLGAGEGNNWWCVMFPPLCVTTTETTDKGWVFPSAAERTAVHDTDAAPDPDMEEKPGKGTGVAEDPWDVETTFAFRLNEQGDEVLVQEKKPVIRWALLELGVRTSRSIARTIRPLTVSLAGISSIMQADSE